MNASLAVGLVLFSTVAGARTRTPPPLPEFAQRLADATQSALTGRGPGYKEVLKTLTPAQRRWHREYCSKTANQESMVCGYINTPLVLAFRGAPVEFTTGAMFEFARGVVTKTDWPTSATPWIARDLDGNGRIDSGEELFGSNTVLPDGRLAKNGFEALAALDSNHDGVIDAGDAAFGSLVVWGGGELVPLSTIVKSISLSVRVSVRCDARENCERERTSFEPADTEAFGGEVVDVYLPAR